MRIKISMHEIKCPSCGKTFNLNKTDYEDILNQDAQMAKRFNKNIVYEGERMLCILQIYQLKISEGLAVKK